MKKRHLALAKKPWMKEIHAEIITTKQHLMLSKMVYFIIFLFVRNNTTIFLCLYKVIISDLYQTIISGQSQTGRLPAGVKSNGNGIKLDTR